MQVSPHNTHSGRRSCSSASLLIGSQRSFLRHLCILPTISFSAPSLSSSLALRYAYICFHTKFFLLHCATPQTHLTLIHDENSRTSISPVYNYHNLRPWYHFSLRIILAVDVAIWISCYISWFCFACFASTAALVHWLAICRSRISDHMYHYIKFLMNITATGCEV